MPKKSKKSKKDIKYQKDRLKCDTCGTQRRVFETECPLSLEVYGRHEKVNLCEKCYTERCYDI